MTISDQTTTPGAFDLGTLRFTDSLQYRVKHPASGEETGWTLLLAGPAHPRTLAAQEELFRRQQDEQEKSTERAVDAAKAGKTVPAERRSLAELRQRNAADIANRVLGWTPIVIDGETVEYSEQRAQQLLGDAGYAWLVNQIDTVLSRNASFISGSATA